MRLLIADGNDRKGRAERKAAAGLTSCEDYARVIGEIDPSAHCVLASPADPDEALLGGAALSDFDAMIVTGSSLRIGDRSPPVMRQIELMQAALAEGLPVFGSCWGVHVATVACGGEVGPSKAASEYAFARGVRRTQGGRDHPLFRGRAASWDVPAIHADIVTRPPPGSTVLAENDLVAVQAIAIMAGPGIFWGTQYHPELDLDALATMLASNAEDIVATNQAPDIAAVESYAQSIAAVHYKPEDMALRNELRLGADLTDAVCRRSEIASFLAFATSRRTGSSDRP